MPKWEPKYDDVSEMRSQIRRNFETGFKSEFDRPTVGIPSEMPEQNFVEQCAKVAAFLMDQNAVVKQLERLNEILKKKITNEQDSSNFYLLRKIIEEELQKAGFHPELGKAISLVDPIHFRAAIAHGLLVKDSSLGAKNHGELTHAIQWLLIAWQQQDTDFLKQPAVEVFKRLGEEESVFSREVLKKKDNPKNKRNEKSIWDLIVDDLDEQIDFRAPEYLHMFLIRTQNLRLHELQTVLKARSNKRAERAISGPYHKYSSKELSSPKLFKRKNKRGEYQHDPEKMKNVLIPSNLTIDMDAFAKRSTKSRKK